MRYNTAVREVILKIVYYGPGLAGKTTNLQVVHDRSPAAQVSDLVSVDTHSERTLHFDWLNLELGRVQGHQVRLEFFTVPGQNYYAATRRQVLQGVDGVVFVADSRREALDENIDSMNEMLNNLRHHGLPEDLPVVMQYNKQDLPTALRPEQLEPLMNVRGWPSFAATATLGEGVIEAVRAVAGMVAERAGRSQFPSLDAPEPDGGPEAPPKSWLISCFRCQTILEVPDAAIGAIYTCGVCGSTLEVNDEERGLTRPPAGTRHYGDGPLPDQSPVGGTSVLGLGLGASSGAGNRIGANALPGIGGDESRYGLQSLPAPTPAGAGALGVRRSSVVEELAQAQSGLQLEGYQVLEALDDSVQGRRLRVRELASGRTLRALTLDPTLIRQPGYRDSLEPYVRMAAPIKHPNVLQLASLRPTGDGAVLLSMDSPDHEPLAHILARRRALAPPHAMGLLRQVALALEEAARHGVVHGWLRPEVVLVSPDGNTLVDELCLPKNHRFLVRELAGASAATEYYLAPEHLNEEARSDLRSDIFMLGALLFRMITGEGLVTGYSAHEALHKVFANGARPLRATQAGVSRDLDLFYQRLVATERKDRFQTYRELIDALDKFGGGAKRQTLRLTGSNSQPSTGRTTGQVPRRAGAGQISSSSGGYGRVRSGGNIATAARPQRRRKSGGVAVVVTAVAALVVVVLGALFLMTQKSPNAPVTESRRDEQRNEDQRTKPTESAAASVKPAVTKAPSAVTSPEQKPPVAGPPATTAAMSTNDAIAKAIGAPTGTELPLTPLQRAEARHKMGDLVMAEQYHAALAVCDRFPLEERFAQQKFVMDSYLVRKRELEIAIVGAGDLSQVRLALNKAQGGWGMPGNVAWAKEWQAKLDARVAATPAPAPVPAVIPNAVTVPAPEPVPPSVATPDAPVAVVAAPPPVAPIPVPEAPPLNDAGASADARLDQALLQNQPVMIPQAIGGVDAASADGKALRRKAELWAKRVPFLNRAVAAKTVKLRIVHPTTGEQWDLASADANGVEATSPSGARSALSWQQLAPKELAVAYQSAATLADVTAEEQGIAVVMSLIGGDSANAAVLGRKAKAAADPALAADLDALLTLHRRRDAAEILDRAQAAIRANNAKALSDALADLKRQDRSVQTTLATQISSMETALTRIQTNRAAVPAGRDEVSFTASDDLAAFPESTGSWQVDVRDGRALNLSDRASLQRHDLGNVHAAAVTVIAQQAKGVLSITFRDVLVEFDLAAGTYTAKGKNPGKPRPFTVLTKTPLSLFFDKKDDTSVRVTIGNGVETQEVAVAGLDDNLAIAIDNGAIAIDDVKLTRDKAVDLPKPGANAVANPNANGKASPANAALLRQQGWEVLGGAYLDSPAVVLPPSPTQPSGIATTRKDNIVGYDLTVKGQGVLRVQLGKLDDREAKWLQLDVPLPGDLNQTAELTVRFTNTALTVFNAKGEVVSNTAITESFTHLMLIAPTQATLMALPRPRFQ